MKTAVMYGAGNVGRGFLGQLFSESGYEVVFVDIVPELIAALNARGSYRLRLVSNEGEEEVIVRNVRAVDGRRSEEVAAEIAACELMATAVGANALPKVAPTIAAGLARRAPRPLDIIVCENLKDAPSFLRTLLKEHLPPSLHGYLERQVGLVEAVIARMVPFVPAELAREDPSFIIAEPYKVLPVNRAGFVGEIPPIVGLEAHDRFAAYVDRKLYLHNAGHAMLGYLGYQKGLTYGYEALADPDIRPWLHRAWDEAQRALVAEHGFDPAALREHVADLERRFANRALGDTILRLARDPLRKLGRHDRLVGAALLAQAHGIRPEALALGIAAALAFSAPEDPSAQELQRRIAQDGLSSVLREVCQLDPESELSHLIASHYVQLRQGAWPRPSGPSSSA